MQVVKVTGNQRQGTGTAGAREARNQGLIPAVVYGGGEVAHIGVKLQEVKSLIYTPDFKIAEVQIDGATHKCIVKDVQMHPVTDNVMHVDFLRLVDGHPIKVNIPVKFKGVSPGVKEGGKLVPMMRRVKVKTLPENLVDELFVDISELELGGSVRVRDIEINDKLEIMTTGATPVANVEVPRALKSEEAEAEEAAAEAGGEGAEGAAEGEEAAAAEKS